MAFEVIVFGYFGFAILFPFLLFVIVTTFCISSEANQSVSVKLSLYIARYPFSICIYHCLLTIILSAFCGNEVMQNMNIALDLNYYVKTSIRATEANDAIQDAKYFESYNYWQHYGEARRRQLGADSNDFVAVYHSGGGDWDNVLTSDRLVDICHFEKMFLSLQSCLGGSSTSSMIDLVFTDDCEYITSFSESLPLFGLVENEVFLGDNVNPSRPESAVLLSYYSTDCKLKLSSVDSSVSHTESTYFSIDMCYCQSDLINDVFLFAGLHDLKLSIIAMVVSLLVLSFSVGLKFLFALLFTMCIICSLIVSAGILPLFGFSYFSAFNVLAIFVVTGVGADAIMVFVSGWYKCFDGARVVGLSNSLTDGEVVGDINMAPLFPLVLQDTYASMISGLTFSLAAAFVSFMSDLTSPIVVMAQLGAFMGMAMVTYFVLLHIILIPGWVFVIKMDQHCRLYAPCMDFATLFSRWSSKAFVNLTEKFKLDGYAIDRERGPGVTDAASSGSGNVSNSDGDVAVRSSSQQNSSALTNVSTNVEDNRGRVLGDESGGIELHEISTEFVHDDFLTPSPSTHNNLSTVKKKQSLCLGCSVLSVTLASLLLVLFAISALIVTDFGLPHLFQEGSNVSDVMRVARDFKSDILTLSGSGGSSIPPQTAAPSSVPTHTVNRIPTAAPTKSPTFFPTPLTLTKVPSLSPTRASTRAPTRAPTPLRTQVPTASSDVAIHAKTSYSVSICYGVDINKENLDSVVTAKTNYESFSSYADSGGLLSDLEKLCSYLADNRKSLEMSTPDSDCIYNQLMATTGSSSVTVYERIGLWMSESKERYYQVGVEAAAGGAGTGNFGLEENLWLSWLCQPIDCVANITSFFDKPDHALKMIDRWNRAVYDFGSADANKMNVVSLTSSDAWLFPLLSDRVSSSVYYSGGISFFGCLVLLLLATRNLKISLLIGFGMLFVLASSLLLHAIIFSSVIDLIDVIVLISFIGIIIDYPTHMAFHYWHDLEMKKKSEGTFSTDGHPSHSSLQQLSPNSQSGSVTEQTDEDAFHKRSFSYMRGALFGPALTSIGSALPLLFAEFTLISKAGEYVLIMTVCTYLYVSIVMPTLLRLLGEVVFVRWRPCR